MFSSKMYVRCPADKENMEDPRVFVCGQIIKIDEFKRTLMVKTHDPFKYLLFFEDLPHGIIEVPMEQAVHCSLFIGTNILYQNDFCKILSERKGKDGYYYYYVQFAKNKKVTYVCESDIVASFTNGRIDPAVQLSRYEFQNPCWFMGHAVVSRSMNILENSIYGFKELAGSKIYLLPHQVNTIMRCLQEDPCRYMLADEVGMGKTIEAISVLKIYMQNRSNIHAIIIAPSTLKEQWKTELLLKFSIAVGLGKDNNSVTVKTTSELNNSDITRSWDFVIIDEIHRYLADKQIYNQLHAISMFAKNILLLSATPVQQRRDEYLDLLSLLYPQKYDTYDIDKFAELVGKQSRIIQKTALILDDLEDFIEEIGDCIDADKNPHDSENCIDLYEEIFNDLEEICDELNDPRLHQLLYDIKFEADDLGVYHIKVIISYICTNYQIESNIIRNRRKILENSDDGERLFPTRELTTVAYSLDADKNVYESLCYQLLADWLVKNVASIDIEQTVRPLLGTFFSSPWAFISQAKKCVNAGLDEGIIVSAENWLKYECDILERILEILDDPETFEDAYSTRIVSVINLLYEELYDKKIVLFTNYPETFSAYKCALENVFPADEVSFFGASMPASEIEVNSYKFQNDEFCRIMLCDYTGGEGRNFQCADYIIHIDLPWDANTIEQRIGRLDRLERDMSRPIVYSVVVYAEDTFEAALFSFWRDGLKIFTQSLSGMEIIMKDINHEITEAIKEDFKYGLFERIPKVIELADSMREIVRKEQNYDAAGFLFRPMYAELKRLIDYYIQNENTLFTTTMSNWASLAGFRGQCIMDGVITYTASSFSPKSAINSQLIPPHWNDYLNNKQNKFVNNVQNAYNMSKAIEVQDRSIKGTFIRKLAIENDYLHFFAPGDDIFDCIVNNALNSCIGRASAFAIKASINWRGLIFTWSLAPNEAYLLDNNVSVYTLSPYKHYLMSEQVIVPISIDNVDNFTDERIVGEYVQLINAGYNKGKTIHLGKRSHSAGFLKDNINGNSNISWFKDQHPQDVWTEIVSTARKASYEKVIEQFKRRSNIRGAREEMERTLSARVANSEFYGIDDDKIEALKQEQEYILEAIRRPKVTLDSAAFVWMVEISNG